MKKQILILISLFLLIETILIPSITSQTLTKDNNFQKNQPPVILPDGLKVWNGNTCRPRASKLFYLNVHDPEGDTIYYKYNWGDGTSSEWITSEARHRYYKYKTYYVSAEAIDDPEGDGPDEDDGSYAIRQEGFSGYNTVTITVTGFPVFKYNLQIFNRIPIIYQLLNYL